jgi:hypothetical protein
MPRGIILLSTILLSTIAPAAAHEPGAPAPSNAAAPSAMAGPTLHLRGGRWFDGERFRPMAWYAVGGRLTARRPARVDVVIDLRGRWVIPPLAEAHNHDLQNAWNAARSSAAYLARGIFYSGQMCGWPEQIQPFRGFLSRPGSVDVVYAEACISSSDGHPLGIALAGAKAAGMEMKPEDVRDNGYWAVDTLADLDARWDKIAAARPAIVKVILIDSANYAANRQNPALFGYNGLDPALLPEIVRRARVVGARVAAHVDTAADFAEAVEAGVDLVAHLPGYRIAAGKTAADYRIAERAAAEAARRGIKVMTTTAASRYAVTRDPAQGPVIDALYRDNIARLRGAGVELLPGSDRFDGSVLDEIDNLERLGVMPRTELLRRVTELNARALFPGRDIGRFAEGAEASLVALAADPLLDLSALKRPMLLLKQGELLSTR